MSARSKLPVSLAAAVVLGASLPAAALAADGRGYELVTPDPKYGSSAGVVLEAGGGQARASYAVAAADGNRLFFQATGPMGTTDNGSTTPNGSVPHSAGRRSSGWSIQGLLPQIPADQVYGAGDLATYWLQTSGDGRAAAFSFAAPIGGAYDWQDPTLQTNPGRIVRLGAADAPVWLSRPVTGSRPPVPGVSGLRIAGASPDLRRVYFTSLSTHVDGEPARGTTIPRVYVYDDGTVRNVDADSGAATGASAAGISPGTRTEFRTPDETRNQVSADGSRFVYVAPNPSSVAASVPKQVYVYDADLHESVLASRDQHVDPDGAAAAPTGVVKMAATGEALGTAQATVATANRQGNSVVFQSKGQLTADAPADTTLKAYRFDMGTKHLTYLAGASGLILHISDDGQRVLYVTSGTAGRQLRLWQPSGSRTLGDVGAAAGYVGAVRATADASVYVFQTSAALRGQADHPAGTDQVYRYVVDGDSLTCLSCGPNASSARLSNYNRRPGTSETHTANALRDARGASDDLSKVFFDTETQLAGPEENGAVRDVYEWTADGIQRISTGRSDLPTYYLDSSADGSSVFIATAEGIWRRDTDGSYDIYDARIGARPEPEEEPPACPDGADCRGQMADPPSVTKPGSDLLAPPSSGAQHPLAPSAPRLTIHGVRRANRSVTLLVVVPGAGRLKVSGAGLSTRSMKARRATRYTVRVSFTRATLRRLARGSHVVLRARVTFTPTVGKPTAVRRTITYRARTRA